MRLSWKPICIGTFLLLAGVRGSRLLVRSMGPSSRQLAPDPDLSDRKAREGERRAQLAVVLDASEGDLEASAALRDAQNDATRTLLDLGHEAGARGATKLAYQAMELQSVLVGPGARSRCSLGAMQSVDAAAAAVSPEIMADLTDRLELARRHVRTTCRLATLLPEPP